MKKSRLIYFILVCSIILLGLVSRKISYIPLFIGDILWAMMIFFIIRFIFIKSNIKSIFWVSLMFCYLVEVSQLIQLEWLNNIRKTILGRLILGQGFLLSDIIAYTIGILMATFLDKIKINK